jgi:hypothetical protein
LTNIVPAFDADVPDNHFLLRQRVDFGRGPWPLVVDLARQFELPSGDIDRLDVFDVVMRVEARRLDHLRLRIGRRQMVGPEDQALGQIVPARHRAQRALHLVGFGDIAAGQKSQRAEAHRAAQELAAVDRGQCLAIDLK